MAKIRNHNLFSGEDEQRLIQFVKENELIFNVHHKQYRNIILKNRLWTEFAQEMKKDVIVCQKKWSNIRDFFKKCHNQKSMRTGSSVKSQLRLEQLSFLQDLIDKESTLPHIEATQTEDTHENDTKYFEFAEEGFANHNLFASTQYKENDYEVNQTFEPTPNKLRKQSCRSRESSVDNPCYDRHERTELLKTFLKQRSEPKEPKVPMLNQMDSLFLNFSKTIQNFPVRDQIDIKQTIFNLIADKERFLLDQRREDDPLKINE